MDSTTGLPDLSAHDFGAAVSRVAHTWGAAGRLPRGQALGAGSVHLPAEAARAVAAALADEERAAAMILGAERYARLIEAGLPKGLPGGLLTVARQHEKELLELVTTVVDARAALRDRDLSKRAGGFVAEPRRASKYESTREAPRAADEWMRCVRVCCRASRLPVAARVPPRARLRTTPTRPAPLPVCAQL